MIMVSLFVIFAISGCQSELEQHDSRGLDALKNEDYETAISEFTRVLEIKPDHVGALSSRGYAYYYVGDYLKALKDFSDSLELKESRSIYDARGQAYLKLELYDLAIGDFSKSLEIGINPHTLDHRGLALFFQKSYELSLQDFSAAISMYPENSEYYIHRADVYIATGQDEKAITDLNTVVEVSDNDEFRSEAEEKLKNLLES